MSITELVSLVLFFLPDGLIAYIFYGLFATGAAMILASWFVWFIPFINQYRWPVQALGVLVFGIGAFLSGGIGVEQVWKSRVAELEAKVKVAEQQSQEANTQIQTVYVDRVKVVHDTETKIITQIKEVEKQIDSTCKVDPAAIDILNRAAIDPTPNKEAK